MATTKSVLKRVCDIIETELGLSEGQVYLYKQKWTLPPSSGLWIAVGMVTPKPFAVNSRIDSAGNEVQTVNVQGLVSIDAQSQDTSALDAVDDITAALQSQTSENFQALDGFRIARLPQSVVDLSEVEGAAIPYRFNVSTMVLYAHQRVKPAPYYDTFLNPTIEMEP